jgi:hypothetical protein
MIIFILELVLIFYLQKKKITLKQLCYDNYFNKRLKRKKQLVIQMGHLSHAIEIK